MLEYSREVANARTGLILGAISVGWNTIRAGAGIARNLRQPRNVTEQVAFRSMFFEGGSRLIGAGADEGFRDAGRIASTYGGRAADWVKKASTARWTNRAGREFEVPVVVDGEVRHFELYVEDLDGRTLMNDNAEVELSTIFKNLE